MNGSASARLVRTKSLSGRNCTYKIYGLALPRKQYQVSRRDNLRREVYARFVEKKGVRMGTVPRPALVSNESIKQDAP